MPGSILGTKVLRLEDKGLLTGRGKYVGDIVHDECLEAAFVRSPYPHAKILKIEKSAALEVDGVVEIFSAKDLDSGKLAGRFIPDENFLRSALAEDVVRFAGESVVLVLAENAAAAKDAVELVEVTYEELPARVNPEGAFLDDGVSLFPQREDGDVVLKRFGKVEDIHSDAEVLVTARFLNNRMAVVPMEPHAISAVPPNLSEDGRLVIWLSTQGAHEARKGIAESLGMDENQIRLISPWVGGGFGGKAGWEPEFVAVARAACLTKRPVRWLEERSENLLSMHGRDQIQYVRMGATRDGKLTSLEAFVIADAGGYLGVGGLIPMGTRLMSQGVYNIPKIQFDFAAACTNKTPLGAFRGAGRPEASALVERMVDLMAYELEIDPIELRRKNLIPSGAFPCKTATGITYDSGDYEKTLDIALEKVDYAGIRAEQKKRQDAYKEHQEISKTNQAHKIAVTDIKFLGVGLCCYVEITGGQGSTDYGAVEINSDGTATIRVGTSSHGQGHQTAFSMIVSETLGIPLEDIEFLQADTDEVPRGQGTGGSRSAQIGGSAILKSATGVLEQARELAAHLLEANPEDIVVSDGEATEHGAGLAVKGSPATVISWKELASAVADEERRPQTLAERLFSETDFVQSDATFPFGTHIAVVEVDANTGKVDLLRHIAVDDCGTILNPMIVEGQQHGGMTSGISQVLYENMEYDLDANPRTTNLAEYLMPSAMEFPALENLEAYLTETPTHLNPLGVKGIGESGSVGATPAVQNAIVDALSFMGVRHIDLPITPEKTWQAMKDARAEVPTQPVQWPSFA